MDYRYALDSLTREGVLGFDGVTYLDGNSSRKPTFSAALCPSNQVVRNNYLRNADCNDSFSFSEQSDKKSSWKSLFTGGIVFTALLYAGHKFKNSKFVKFFIGDSNKTKKVASSKHVVTKKINSNKKIKRSILHKEIQSNSGKSKFIKNISNIYHNTVSSFKSLPKGGQIAIGVGAVVLSALGIKTACNNSKKPKNA